LNRPIHGGNLVWAAALASCPASCIVDFSASINPLGMPRSALEAIAASLQRLSAYPDPNYGSLREAIAQFHRIEPDWILAGNGSAELLTWVARELAAGEITYLITPAFSDYFRALRAFDGKIGKYELDLSRRDLAIPERGESIPKNAGIIINNPHNPTGKLWRREEIIPFLDKYALVVVDEAFMDFLPPEEEQSLIGLVKDYPNLVVLRSLTKFYSLAGLRIGYAVASRDRLQKWQKWRDPWSVNSIAVEVAISVLKDADFQQKTWDWLVPTREILFNNLKAIESLQPLPSSANFLLVKTQFSSSQLQLELLKKDKILIRDCLSFPELGENYFRVAVRSEAENKCLVEKLDFVISREGTKNWR
jgi:L-threonine-O-3-phosphate decarboxylase